MARTPDRGWQPTSGAESQIWGDPRSVAETTWASIRRWEGDAGLHQIIDVAAHLARGHDLATLAKRCLVASSFVVFKTPSMVYRQLGPDERLGGLTSGWDTSAELAAVEEAVLRGGLHENQFCVVLPQSTTVSCETLGGESLIADHEQAADATAALRKLEEHLYSLPVGADYAMVQRLLWQDAADSSVNTGLLMPAIANLSLSDLTELRKDYGEPFARLQYALKRYLDSIANFESEQRFEHLVEEIDHECRVAQDEFEGIRRKHSRSMKGMLVTSSLVGVAAVSELVAPGVATAASAALGSVSLNHVLSQRIKTTSCRSESRRQTRRTTSSAAITGSPGSSTKRTPRAGRPELDGQPPG